MKEIRSEPYSLTPAPRLTAKDAIDLGRLGHRLHVSKHEYVFRAEQVANRVYLIESGRVKVFRLSPTGQHVLLFLCGTGEIVGLHQALVEDGRQLCQGFAQASEDSVLSAIALQQLKSFLAIRYRAAQYVFEALSYRLNETSEKLANFAATNVVPRIARIILHMTACYGKHVGGAAVEVGVPLTQQELADMAGATRQTVNGVMQMLKTEGIISVSRQYVRIENNDRLRQIAVSDGPYENEKLE